MTFDFEPGEYALLYEQSSELQAAAESVRSTAADTASSGAALLETMDSLSRALEQESDGLYSQVQEQHRQLEDAFSGLGESGQLAQEARDPDSAEQQVDYIRQTAAEGEQALSELERIHEQSPDPVRYDHDQLPGQVNECRGLMQRLSEAAGLLSDWWKYTVTQQREAVDLNDPAAVAQLTEEDIDTRGHWRDLVNAAPPGSVGSVLVPIADNLYAAVGEIAGSGIGRTFEDNKALFNQVNDTPQAMAAAITQWAAYETDAIQSNPSTNAAAKAVGALMSEYDRASLLWQSYLALNPEEAASLPSDPYKVAGQEQPIDKQVYDRSRSTWTAGGV